MKMKMANIRFAICLRFILDFLGYEEGEATNMLELLHPDFVQTAWDKVGVLLSGTDTTLQETERIKRLQLHNCPTVLDRPMHD